MNKTKPHIYILYTGGTVGMKSTPDGYQPCAHFLTEQMATMPEFHHSDMPSYTLLEFSPLIDSSEMTPEHWLKIAKLIAEHYDRADGFVIIHGTDTMAYTASALSFMLENLSKPVILTGSQVPLCEVHTDARENLLCAMLLAGDSRIQEVGIYFANRLLRGNRSRKINNSSVDAFASPNYPPLAEIGTSVCIFENHLRKTNSDTFAIHPIESISLLHWRLFPGMNLAFLSQILTLPVKGIVLECYGNGNAPVSNPHLKKFCEAAAAKHIVMVNTTQCLAGSVDMSSYATGKRLGDWGIISGFDMTPEAVLCKLAYLFTRYSHPPTVKKYLQEDLRGELSKDR